MMMMIDDDDDEQEDDVDVDDNRWLKTTVQLTFFQSCGFVDLAAGNLTERRHKVVQSVKAMLRNIMQTTTSVIQTHINHNATQL